jgi:hypothetical protein
MKMPFLASGVTIAKKLHLAELWCSWMSDNHVVMHPKDDYYLVVGSLQDI